MKKILSALILIIALGFSGTRLAHAVSLENASDNLDKSVDVLLDAKDDENLSEADQLAKETEARIKVVTEALNLSLTETDDLQNRLVKIQIENDEIADELKVQYLAYLKDAALYFKEVQTKLEKVDSPASVKALAAELKDYRENLYDQNIQNIINFLLVFQIDDLIATTQSRWDKITSDLQKLEKNGSIKSYQFSSLMASAKKYIKEASSLNQEAKKITIVLPEKERKGEPAAAPALTPAPTVLENPTDNQKIEAVKEPLEAEPKIEIKELSPTEKSRQLIETTLTKLKSSYEIFLKISRETKKLLRP